MNSCWIDNVGEILVNTSRAVNDNDKLFLVDGEFFSTLAIRNDYGNNYYLCIPEVNIEIGKEYKVYFNGEYYPVYYRYIVRTAYFEENMTYDGDDLGQTYHKDNLELRLWAPTSSKVTAVLEKGSDHKEYPMERKDRGLWYTDIEGDYDQYRYYYLVYINGKTEKIVDPYALSCNANGKEAYIINPDKCEKEFYKDKLTELKSYTDAVIYETSVRDFSIKFGGRYAGKFLGMVQNGLKSEGNHLAGIDHLVDLGITHVQLMPILDFKTVDEEHPERGYNWGYDPAHYFIPEGSYCTNPNDPYRRVTECQKMIQQFHKHNIRVILDVVYNHMYDKNSTSLDRCVPYYYFRMDTNGNLSNGSFCGNDLDSTRKMTRKLIIDSLKHWTKFYGADGFRFDLLGIIDIDTSRLIEETLKGIDKNILLLGEGWNMPTMLNDQDKTDIENQAKVNNIAFFNDRYRDSLKGSGNGDLSVKGILTGDLADEESICTALQGYCLNSLFDSPQKSINYLTCHDGVTLWDKVSCCNFDEDYETRKKRIRLMIFVLLISQGVPFIYGGMEFCRSKKGETNSYNSSDAVNMLDWSLLDLNYDITDFLKKIIYFRKENYCFRFSRSEDISQHTYTFIAGNQLIVYELFGLNLDYKKMNIFINPTSSYQEYILDKEMDIIFDASGVTLPLKTNCVTLNPLEFVIVGENDD